MTAHASSIAEYGRELKLNVIIKTERVKVECNYKISRSQMFFKIDVLKTFVSFTGKHLRWSLFLIKLQSFRCATLLKETPRQVLFCEIGEIFKNILFYRIPLVAASIIDKFYLQTQSKNFQNFAEICAELLFYEASK